MQWSAHTTDYFSSLKNAFDRSSLSPEPGGYSDSDESEEGPTQAQFGLVQDLQQRNIAVKYIKPHFWEGQWKDSSSIFLGSKMVQKEFSVLSWNVFFGLRNQGIRMDRMGKVIRELDPDFIYLQEVTKDSVKMILSQGWARMYFVSDPTAAYVSTYGNIILSKTKFQDCGYKKLESNLGRKFQFGTINASGTPLTMGTFHLESPSVDAPLRQRQLQEIQNLTLNCPCAIICGDTNFFDDTEVSGLGDRYKDAWQELYQKTPTEKQENHGITFDTVNNLMCRAEYKERDDFEEKQLRLDRCFYTSETLEPIEMKVLGKDPYFQEEWISDHYGLYLKLRIKK